MGGLQNLDLLSVGVAVAAIGVLGFTIYVSNPSSITNRVFLYFTSVTALWGVVNYFSYQFSDPTVTIWLLRSILFLAVFQAYFLYELFLVFPNTEFTFSSAHTYLLFPLTVLTAIVTESPAAFYTISGSDIAGNIAIVQSGPGLALFAVVAVGLVIAAIKTLVSKYIQAEKAVRRALGIILIGVLVMFGLIITFNLIIAIVFADPYFVPFGALFTFPFVGLTAYAITKHHLFKVKVIATAALVFTLSIIALIEIILSDTFILVLFRVSIFILILMAGVLLIQSVLKEVLQREEIEKLSNEKSEFMSFASHEIRNPITAMRGYASLMVDGTIAGVNEEGREVAQKILVNGDTVLSLISEFLNKSKVELGQISYSIADTDLGKTITSIGEGFKAHAREKGLTLEIKIDYANLMVKADEAKLREVVGNIVDNSMKYTKNGGVTIEVEKRNGMGRVIVSDTGVGIPPETISQLFQKFSRADAHKMNLLGTGLGLYLAKTFVEGMGGKIWAESDGQDKGSRFIIELHTV